MKKAPTDKKSYYAIIPADVRYDPRLTAYERLLFGEITALCSEKGFCWASNAYFARLYDKNVSTISRWISHLIKAGYIRSVINKEAGNKRQLYLLTKKSIGMDKKGKDLLSAESIGIGGKSKQNNTDKSQKNTKDKIINDFPSVPLSSQALDEQQEQDYHLLVKFGVSPSVADNLIFNQATPRSSIEQTIKNGLAKAVYTAGFTLEAGYIVQTLNKARKESKIVGTTKLVRRMDRKFREPQTKRIPLTPEEFEDSRRKMKAALAS